MGNNDDVDDNNKNKNNDNNNNNNNNNDTGYLCLLENPHHRETNVKCHFLANVTACNLRLT